MVFMFIPSVFASGTLDEYYWSGTSTMSIGSVSSSYWRGQSFTTSDGTSGLLTQLNLNLIKIGTGGSNYTIKMKTVSSGKPGTTLCTFATLSPSDVSSSLDWVQIDVDSGPCYITENTQYYIIIGRSSLDSSNYIKWSLDATGAYSEGVSAYCASSSGDTSWTGPATADYGFEEYWSSYCSDGYVNGSEECDDDNISNGDGCSSTCTIETGYECTGEPSSCSVDCGDGILTGDEECDDGDEVSGDGCSDVCAVEHGFECLGEPSVCSSECSDELIASDEECDDGDLDDGDGCDDLCVIEDYWECDGEPSVCLAMVECWEVCDDGASNYWFTNGTVCGEGVAQDYPLNNEPFCESLLCFKDCDNGAGYEVFDYWTVCGEGEAVDYPLDDRPYCLEYYSYACSEWYYFLCDTESSCEDLGVNYHWDNSTCNLYFTYPYGYETELEALNSIGTDLNAIYSQNLALYRLFVFTAPFQLLMAFLTVVGLLLLLFKNWFTKI